MDIHVAIEQVLRKYGLKLIHETILVNYLADYNCFKEFRSASNILKEIIICYGHALYDIKSNGDSYNLVITKYKTDFHKNYGYQMEMIDYLFDCLLYGLSLENNVESSLKKLRETHLSSERIKKVDNNLLFYANLYHFFGMNVTCIMGKPEDKISYLYDDPWNGTIICHPFKEPCDTNWKIYFDEEQDIDYIQKQDWNEASGIGAVIGFGGLRALDFDVLNILSESLSGGNKLEKYIKKVLLLLKLPHDYQWVVRSGSGYGLHIIFRTKEINDFTYDSVAFIPTKTITEKGEGFERLELRWKDHLVLPPSKSSGYYDESFMVPECEWYRFYWGRFPNYSPMTVDINNLNNLLNYFSSNIDVVTYAGSARILGHEKLTTEIDSWGGSHLRFRATEKWALECGSPNGNEEYVTWLLSNSYKRPDLIDKAVELLKNSNSAISHYNLASLIAHKVIEGNKSEAMSHFVIAKDSNILRQIDINVLKYAIDSME